MNNAIMNSAKVRSKKTGKIFRVVCGIRIDGTDMVKITTLDQNDSRTRTVPASLFEIVQSMLI